MRQVVLEDGNFNELTVSEGHGFGGWPDNTTSYIDEGATDIYGNELDLGGDEGHQFQNNELY